MRVLFIGETWITHTVHIKGVDSFEQSGFGCGVGWIKKALESGGHEVTHLPAHQAIDAFPDEQQLTQYDVVICSDVGSNTLVLSTPTMVDSRTRPNALESIRRFVAAGGGFAMIGGYMSFQGIGGKAGYAGTPIEQILPVSLQRTDDRVELPEGSVPRVVKAHPIVEGTGDAWPAVLGYNRLLPKEGGEILVRCAGDILVAAGVYERGRTMAFATDCAPHWAPPEFLEWPGYALFWRQASEWLGSVKRSVS